MAILNMVLPGGSGSKYQLGVLSSNKNSIDLTYSQTSDTFTISYNGDGDIEIEISDESVVSVELVSGTTYRVSGVADGSAVLTVSATQTQNYFTSETVEIEVGVELTIPATNVLNDNDWDVISAVSQAELTANYWSVGDRKAVTLNGMIGGNLTLSNKTLYVYILGINHNGSTGIDFGGFKTALSGGTDVALIDSGYNTNKTSGTWLNIYNSRSNSGGWKSCRMRYYILGSTNSSTGGNAGSTTATNPKSNSLMAALPSALRAVMKPMTIYSNNTGGGSDTASYVTATVDYLPLLAEYEVYGVQHYANSAEKYYQKQYQYYINGNSKKKYRHSSTSSTCIWWLRSIYSESAYMFCVVSTNGSDGGSDTHYSYGVAPIFRV